MKFVCERCNTRYSIADEKVRQKILKIRCKTCENVITVRDPASAASEPASVSASQPPPPPARAATTPAPVTAAAAREWFVAVNGDQVGPVNRAEAAKTIAGLKPDDEVYVWKEGLDGWKPPAEVPPIQQELNALRARPAPPQPRVPPAPPSRPAAPRPAAARPAPAAARPAPAAALAHANPFEEQDHTQIQPFDAGMLAPDFAAKPAAAPAAARSGRTTNGSMAAVASAPPAAAPSSLDGLFNDLSSGVGVPSAAAAPAAFAPAPAPAHTARAEADLSKLTGFAGFMSRNPGLKFVAGGAVVTVLIALVVVVLVVMPNEQKAPPPPVPAVVEAPKPAQPTEEEARKSAEQRFQALNPPPAQPAKIPSIGPSRVGRADRKASSKSSRPPSISPPPAGSLEPPSIGGVEPPPASGIGQRGGAAPGERVVKQYEPTRRPAGESAGGAGPTEAQINAVVKKRENQAAIKTCYERALKRDNRIQSGRIEVTATMGMSGMVKAVDLNAPAEFAAVESCIKQAVRRWAFPANSDEYETKFTLIMAGSL